MRQMATPTRQTSKSPPIIRGSRSAILDSGGHLGFRQPSWIQEAILDSGGHLGFRRPSWIQAAILDSGGHLGFRGPSWIQAAILDSGGHLGFRRPPSPTWYPNGVFLNSLDSQFVCEFIHTYRLLIYSSYNYQTVFQTSNFAIFQAYSQSSSVVFVIPR